MEGEIMQKKKKNSVSLLSKQAMGGLIGGGGYNFQDSYIISRLPNWLSDSSFIQILKEGLGDVEVRFNIDGKDERVYLQVKDHLVKPAEFKQVLKEFQSKDNGSPDTYREFWLACVGMNERLLSLQQAIERFRNASNFYEAKNGKIISDTKKDLIQIAGKLGISSSLDFLMNKVYFDTDLPGLKQQGQLVKIFVGGVQKVPRYQLILGKALEVCFGDLCVLIGSSAGKTLERKSIEAIIDKAFLELRNELKKTGLVIRMYHWENEPLEASLQHHILLDWSEFFERKSRKIPAVELWQTKLLPELQETQKKIRKTAISKLIKFEGSSCLSVGIAFGWAFPEVAQYVIELTQRSDTWRSDAKAAPNKFLVSKQEIVDDSASDLLVLFNVSADMDPKVKEFIGESGLKYKAKLVLQPKEGIGLHLDNSDAIAYVREAKRIIREKINLFKIKRVHLFFSAPLGLAIFFGQLLNAMQDIQCYEEQIKGGYKQSCLLSSS